MDKDDSWLYYREDVVKKIDLNAVLNNVKSVCNALDFKLGHSWQMYVSDLPKTPTMFFTSFELDGFDGNLRGRILHAIHDGPSGLKSKNFSNQQARKYNALNKYWEKAKNQWKLTLLLMKLKHVFFVKVIK